MLVDWVQYCFISDPIYYLTYTKNYARTYT